jgi:extracellular matrix regulatory protein A
LKSSHKILNIGFANVLLIDRIVGMIHSDTAGGKRIRNEAKENGKLIDSTMGKKTRSIIFTDSGHIVLSSLRVESLSRRIESGDNDSPVDEEEITENE